ncbi:MFS transporter [Nonlabens sp. Asnod3-H03]|uniref:POT-type proton-dependent oligopeptide transporter n=1 Tax=Nonlabens sp. Asnod3-H03 TaxID=3160580 RepID=UPI003868E712
MEKIQNQNHTKETLYYSISRMLERASFYGFRAIVILYMAGESLTMKRTEALAIYGVLIGSLVFSQILGAIFGDLFVGNKKSIIFGGIMQAIGAFSLCIASTTGFYAGLVLIVLGNGLFSPNIISNFGKSYLNKTKLLDSGFTILYLAINLGSFLGILIIGYMGERYGYNIGFIISGVLSLISIIPVFIVAEKRLDKVEKNSLSIKKRILIILIALIAVALFWQLHEISSLRTYDLQLQLSEISTLGIPNHLWQSINSIFILPISIVTIILWTYFYSSQFFKIIIGFISGVLSFGILFLIPEVPTEQHTITYLVSLLFLGIAEIHISPIIQSVLTKYSNPKYLAILFSLAFLPNRLFSIIFGLFNDSLYDNPMLGLKIGIIGLIIIGIGLIGFVFWNKKVTNNELRH